MVLLAFFLIEPVLDLEARHQRSRDPDAGTAPYNFAWAGGSSGCRNRSWGAWKRWVRVHSGGLPERDDRFGRLPIVDLQPFMARHFPPAGSNSSCCSTVPWMSMT